MKQVKVTISPDGEVKVEVNGVKGRSCKDLTKQLEAALGETMGSRKKPDYFVVVGQRGMIKS
jgi:hypothetical protein